MQKCSKCTLCSGSHSSYNTSLFHTLPPHLFPFCDHSVEFSIHSAVLGFPSVPPPKKNILCFCLRIEHFVWTLKIEVSQISIKASKILFYIAGHVWTWKNAFLIPGVHCNRHFTRLVAVRATGLLDFSFIHFGKWANVMINLWTFATKWWGVCAFNFIFHQLLCSLEFIV